MKKQHYVFKTIITIILTGLITCTITVLTLYGRTGNKSTNNNIGSSMGSDILNTKMKTIREKINEVYIGEANDEDLKEYAIKGYVAGLNDVYSEYFTAKEMKEFTEETLGNFVGVGINMIKDIEKNAIVIYSTIKNTPAEAAGLKTGDVITAVDGQKVSGEDFENIANMVKGKEGTKVKLTILRDGQEKEYEIERKTIEIIEASSEMISDNIGYLSLTSFDGNAAEQFEKECEVLKNKGAKSLIIDLRNNGGGLVEEATKIGDLFTNKDETLLIQTDNQGKEIVTKAEKDKSIDMNVVVLVNKYSASASEILASILKDNVDKASIVGTKTYGKGVIQTLFQLADGSGLKLTTNEYFSPKHNKINKIGVEPDVVVEDKEFTYAGKIDKEKDKQLQKAIEILQNKK